MAALLVYCVPFLAAVSMTAILFAFPLAISESTNRTFLSGLVIFVSGVACSLTTIALAATRPGERTSLRLVYTGLGALFMSAVLPMVLPGPWWALYLYAALQAVGSAMLLVCFQIVLQVIAARFPLPIAFSNFIMSWGLGSAVGPLISGAFRDSSPQAPLLLAAAATGLGLVVLLCVRRIEVSEPPPSPATPLPIPRTAVHFGWVLIFLGSIFMATFRGIMPDFGVKHDFASWQTGVLLGVLFTSLTLSAFLMRFFYQRFLSRTAYFFAVLGGYVVSTIGLSLTSHPLLIGCFLALMGFSIAAGYYFAGFYALADAAHESRNVGMNEAIASLAGILGPLVGAALAQTWGFNALFLSLAATATVIFGWGYWRSRASNNAAATIN